MHKARKR